MLRVFAIGLLTGLRSLTPLAVASMAEQRGLLPSDGVLAPLAKPAVAAGIMALALGELAGDKMKSAPDRTIPPGLAARLVTGALAGAAVAPRGRRAEGAALAVLGAMIGAYVGFEMRMAALKRYGQTRTGLVEDALTVAGSMAVVGLSRDGKHAH
jgi:uncharacterized membrane protein